MNQFVNKYWAPSVLVAALAAPLLMSQAFAEIQPHFYVSLPQDPTLNEVHIKYGQPKVTDSEITFTLNNDSGKLLFFEDDGTKVWLPQLSERDIATSHVPGQRYVVLDEEGNEYFAFKVTDPDIKYVLDSAAQARFDRWQQELAQVAANNRNTYVPPQDTEPTYRDTQPGTNNNVRGYW